MRRRVFTVAVGLSALLFLTTAVLLPLSYVDGIRGRGVWWGFSRGYAYTHHFPEWLRPDRMEPWNTGAPGVIFYVEPKGFGPDMVKVSLLYPLALTAVLPGGSLVLWLRRRRKRGDEPLCASCGYDLRASAGTCPECGAAIETSQAAE